jgi:hypothetical protein
MRWRKLGHVFSPDGRSSWACTNASFPTAILQSPSVIRVYFTALDANQFGQGSWVDLDASDPRRVLGASPKPVLTLGDLGDFDDAGANPFSVVNFGGRCLMFYQGWQRTVRAPYTMFTGLAIEDPDGQFQKTARVPVLDRTDTEPHIRGAPYVLVNGDLLRMWYVSSNRWKLRGGQLHYNVAIRYAESTDGVRWVAHPDPCVSPEDEKGEYAVGRPTVIVEGGHHRMWYSVRSFTEPYRMGYAESKDGFSWIRKDHEVGISCSPAPAWDSEMICYPFVIRVDDRLLMFYNGNQHGRTGFGCAQLEAA